MKCIFTFIQSIKMQLITNNSEEPCFCGRTAKGGSGASMLQNLWDPSMQQHGMVYSNQTQQGGQRPHYVNLLQHPPHCWAVQANPQIFNCSVYAHIVRGRRMTDVCSSDVSSFRIVLFTVSVQFFVIIVIPVSVIQLFCN